MQRAPFRHLIGSDATCLLYRRGSLLNAEQEQCHVVATVPKLDLPDGDIILQGTGTRSVAFRHSFVRPSVAGPPINLCSTAADRGLRPRPPAWFAVITASRMAYDGTAFAQLVSLDAGRLCLFWRIPASVDFCLCRSECSI
jgi:hypothetical protein